MADTPHNPNDDEWTTTFAKYIDLNESLDQLRPRERNRIEVEIAALQDALLDTPAPSLTAVKQKLEILFEGHMHGLDQGSEERRLILEDIEGLIRAQRKLLGA